MLLRLLRAVHAWRRRDYVTPAHLAAINRYEDTRGIEWAAWRSPKELAQMRRQERRAALRVVGGRRA